MGTWATPPVHADTHRSFYQQTLRQIVHTSIGGTQARIRISNLFGSRPLHIEDVHLARWTRGTSIILANTDRLALFNGQPSVTIPPGASAVSDPVTITLPALSDVAISMYLPDHTGPATCNPDAHQTSYIAVGDVSGDTTLKNAATTGSWYYITNLDIQADSWRGALVTLGASITNGYKSTDNANLRWPDILAQRLLGAGLRIGVLNEGISGNRLLTYGAGESAEARFDRDVLAQPGVRWVIFSDDPINDLGSTRPIPKADQLIAGMQQLIDMAHRHHIQFLCSTLTPYQGANYWTPAGETAREEVNAFLRSKTSGCDAVMDQDLATHDPAHPTQYLPAYDSGDHLHPNDAGMQAIANAVDPSIFTQRKSH
ncbi:SGNH hydrolase [Edaphobacter acidisoli]|uniref:SGNH hydrolase n=1 Tax=Edaphobacter acidisoli TaxID=2040573 RepID=A0A916RQA5_9BACT|nr:SGNH hydrolase [Edaphobacter acidisoli]